MYTYLVVFDCCVMPEPYYKIIEANNLNECWEKAYAISCQGGLSQGNFEIYRRMDEADYMAEPDLCHDDI